MSAIGVADRMLLMVGGILAASTRVLTVVAPPNTWDAVEYHLPCVMLWVSNHNVGIFPPPIMLSSHSGPQPNI